MAYQPYHQKRINVDRQAVLAGRQLVEIDDAKNRLRKVETLAAGRFGEYDLPANRIDCPIALKALEDAFYRRQDCHDLPWLRPQ